MLGYACLNLTLPSSFRTCRLQTLETKGMGYIKELALHNVNQLKEILLWNIENRIFFFRMTSELIPFATHEKMTWNWIKDEEMLKAFKEISQLQKDYQLRLTVHPGQYTLINSPREEVLHNAVKDLNYHAELLQLVGGSDMIIHTGGVYGDKEASKQRFISYYEQLPQKVKSYLRLENDDKNYSTHDVLDIYKKCGVPICFDLHHERCFETEERELPLLFNKVVQTWDGIQAVPKVHLSTGRQSVTDRSHASLISINDYLLLEQITAGQKVDVMLEAKAKDQALLRLRTDLRAT
ncbi:UV damage endonuclease [Alkalihalobacillus alcalophilus ATCC 27647 = CGMCC 1.3604]|uniref:UV damage endonuclease n=1 Tax=Alkalihalobacillus alcalophilus ATCC 27647 = CGMCC 1.3604 TaxID=1218173 RepID=A0A094WHK2_ALKAL|nr:UV DNA damage repair endonuclease UvsE [Alkalihalobacillus alcalophilus]KGA97249.1 UV damage repair endonuclease UvdE [Alkalihalobacillus alcalophilus ATCC 27647 = CGMCC 1.3604]MED1564082.1 UV DNA damage repair endonuclease UvsE [Alkalihalobacillus alcalophilus]THG90458.1 UV damage endonuclease [Alkalihalobacillus alcalophilus ATCC 27647 = CGMCC 1.3604]